jgi:hypothetical protein
LSRVAAFTFHKDFRDNFRDRACGTEHKKAKKQISGTEHKKKQKNKKTHPNPSKNDRF